MSGLWSSGHRNHADRRLPVFLQLHRLRAASQTQARRLLRVLFFRVGRVPVDARSAGYSCDCLPRASPDEGRLGRGCAHQRARLVAADGCGFRRAASPGSSSRGHMGRHVRLDGRSLHPQLPTLRAHALPLHRAVLSGDDRSRAGARDRTRFDNSHRMVRHRSHDPAREQAYQVGDGAGLGQVQPFLIARLNAAIDGFGGAFVG